MLSEAVFHMKFIFLTQSKVWQCCQTLPPPIEHSTGRPQCGLPVLALQN